VTLNIENGVIVVSRVDDSRTARAMHGLSRTLIANMVNGVTVGFVRNLDIVGVGYRAAVKSPKELELALGFSHPVVVEAPAGIEFACPTPTKIAVSGIDKELVGQVAANIRKIRKPEPYKGKGVRYENEKVLRKVGKAGK
jgi:large subunit ribosomal protein L6